MKQLIANWLKAEWFAVALAATFVFPNAWWFFDKTPPTEVISIKAGTPIVAPGGTLIIDYRVNRFRSCGGFIQRIITDSQNVTHLIAPYEFLKNDIRPLGPDIVNRVSAPVPVGAAPGPASYHAEIDYYCNPQQRFLGTPIKISTPPIDFEISSGPLARSSFDDPLPPSGQLISKHARRTDLGPAYDPLVRTDAPRWVAVAEKD